jgi:nicotinamidase-related amidase
MQNGSLAVPGGRDIVPLVNQLLSLPFPVKVATQDFHPRDHISFASNHSPPQNKPLETMITIKNPLNSKETEQTLLWPDHCVQGTKGAELVPELEIPKEIRIVKKGRDKRVEMYSAFADPFKNPTVSKSELADILHGQGVTHVYIVGLAADYCVKYTALDAVKESFQTFVIKEATRAVNPSALDEVYRLYDKEGVKLVGMKDEQIKRVENYS